MHELIHWYATEAWDTLPYVIEQGMAYLVSFVLTGDFEGVAPPPEDRAFGLALSLEREEYSRFSEEFEDELDAAGVWIVAALGWKGLKSLAECAHAEGLKKIPPEWFEPALPSPRKPVNIDSFWLDRMSLFRFFEEAVDTDGRIVRKLSDPAVPADEASWWRRPVGCDVAHSDTDTSTLQAAEDGAMKQDLEKSPAITRISWGQMEIERLGVGKDWKLWPGGGRQWDWNETGTHHVPGIQPADVQELLEHGAEVIVLSRGMQLVLRTCPETLELLKERGIRVHVEETNAAAKLYNELVAREKVAGLFHSTC